MLNLHQLGNGTAGLHLAFEALKQKNDVIVMPIVNFIASFSMAKLYQAKYFLQMLKVQQAK